MISSTYVILLIAVMVMLVVAILLTNPDLSVASISKLMLDTQSSSSRISKPIPTVGDYFCKGWDFRARNNEEQILVPLDSKQTFAQKLFTIGTSIALSAHLGYRPPFIFVDSNRAPDTIVNDKNELVPNLIQDIFPNLNVISLPDLKSLSLSGQVIEAGSSFQEIPEISSPTVIMRGCWKSWKYMDDYLKSVFQTLEFHPAIYHHLLKTYPFIMDRKKPWKGIYVKRYTPEMKDYIRAFADTQTIMFTPDRTINASDLPTNLIIVTEEVFQVAMYASAFLQSTLIDLSDEGWWIGLHGMFRNKVIKYIPGVNDVDFDNFIHPRWTIQQKI